MTTFSPPTPEELVAIRKSMNLSTAEFGALLGFKDSARAVRALEQGEWHGKPYRLTGSAMAALTYARALSAILDAHRSGRFLQSAVAQAEALLPKRMRKCSN